MATIHTMTFIPTALLQWAKANDNLSVLEAAFPYEDRETLLELRDDVARVDEVQSSVEIEYKSKD